MRRTHGTEAWSQNIELRCRQRQLLRQNWFHFSIKKKLWSGKCLNYAILKKGKLVQSSFREIWLLFAGWMMWDGVGFQCEAQKLAPVQFQCTALY